MEIDDYILKPFDPERVHHVVKKCIGEGKCDPAGKMEEQEEKTEPAAAEKQEAEQGNAGVEERREAMVFGKIPVTASRGILFWRSDQDRVSKFACFPTGKTRTPSHASTTLRNSRNSYKIMKLTLYVSKPIFYWKMQEKILSSVLN